MLSASEIKRIRSYQQKKFRDKADFFIAETPKVVETLLAARARAVAVYALSSWIDGTVRGEATGIESAMTETGDTVTGGGAAVDFIEISQKELERISGLVTPNEVLAVFETPAPAPADFTKGISLVLDDIRDPGNMGTILRLADWFGIDRIIASENSADVFQPKCVQASMGSVGNVPVYYSDLPVLADELPQSFPIYGTFMNGPSIYETPLECTNGWFVIGNEAHGISSDFAKHITHRISIPSFATADGGRLTVAESLNAAMSAAVVCSEIRHYS
ncbi:MAG: RNA methyltransferase [Bacteroidales bacterium]|jgi:TrmH family RNA methyltransferase|nr:RNA methyltransferase [Bacteroidales bacterium]